MTEAVYRPLSDLTPVEQEVERARTALRRKEARQARRLGAGECDEMIGPQTRRELARRTTNDGSQDA